MPAAAKQSQSCPMDLALGSKVPAFGSLLSVSLYLLYAGRGGDSVFSWFSNLIACRNGETSYGRPQHV